MMFMSPIIVTCLVTVVAGEHVNTTKMAVLPKEDFLFLFF